jgi:hypothetical protein
LWKGNGVNVIRVAPYAAAQLSSNDFYKGLLAGESGKLGLKERLLAVGLYKFNAVDPRLDSNLVSTVKVECS